jgi:hypothetical protein
MFFALSIKRLSFPRRPYSIDGIKAMLRKNSDEILFFTPDAEKKLKNIWRCRTANTRKNSLRIANDHKAVGIIAIEAHPQT